MTEQEAKTIARAKDLKAPRGVFYKAKLRKTGWCVVRFDCETEKERKVAG